MPRLDDWECQICFEIAEHLTDIGSAKVQEIECELCERETTQRRLLSRPARNLQKRMRAYYNPTIYGGKYDTMGYKPIPSLPDLPGADEVDAKYSKAIENCQTTADFEQATREFEADMPTLADYREWHKRPEWQERKKERLRLKAENKARKERAAAGISPREKPLPGDAKELHR